MSFEEFMSYSAGDGEQVEVCGLELDLISVLFKEHSSDGILKDQYLRDKEGKDKETVQYNNLGEGKWKPEGLTEDNGNGNKSKDLEGLVQLGSTLPHCSWNYVKDSWPILTSKFYELVFSDHRRTLYSQKRAFPHNSKYI